MPKNTTYHTVMDLNVNASYAAAVARAVAAAAWMVASPGQGRYAAARVPSEGSGGRTPRYRGVDDGRAAHIDDYKWRK